ncbi:hypothetical protein K438DRAFT_2029249 [Mycena galopus ATCC 62051]|nr:hypothetical protein K438DRAFT_2029249 [Mycena galopus ATCC 62051]
MPTPHLRANSPFADQPSPSLYTSRFATYALTRGVPLVPETPTSTPKRGTIALTPRKKRHARLWRLPSTLAVLCIIRVARTSALLAPPAPTQTRVPHPNSRVRPACASSTHPSRTPGESESGGVTSSLRPSSSVLTRAAGMAHRSRSIAVCAPLLSPMRHPRPHDLALCAVAMQGHKNTEASTLSTLRSTPSLRLDMDDASRGRTSRRTSSRARRRALRIDEQEQKPGAHEKPFLLALCSPPSANVHVDVRRTHKDEPAPQRPHLRLPTAPLPRRASDVLSCLSRALARSPVHARRGKTAYAKNTSTSRPPPSTLDHSRVEKGEGAPATLSGLDSPPLRSPPPKKWKKAKLLGRNANSDIPSARAEGSTKTDSAKQRQMMVGKQKTKTKARPRSSPLIPSSLLSTKHRTK